MASQSIIRVLVPGPFQEPLDYLLPEDKAPPPIGGRVWVPLRKGQEVGVVAEVANFTHIPINKLKWLLDIIDDTPLFSPLYFDFLNWLSRYYHAPLGEVCQMGMPKILREGKNIPSKKKSAVSSEKGFPPSAVESPLQLTVSQQTAVKRILSSQGSFQAFLLNGATGSGKTEVYLQVIAEIIKHGQQALVLVPEIGLTPQTMSRFEKRFGSQICALHSGLNDTERALAWQAARVGEAKVVIGTRSALFVPFKNLGVIIVDEEHDSSFKQQEGIRYSARDCAVVLANMLNIPIVLGSATPSIESLHNAQKNRYIELTLLERVQGAKMPTWYLIDLRQKKLQDGLSEELLAQIKKHLEANKQVLLFLNRRGFAPAWFCPACGMSPECKHCDTRLTYHAKPPKLVCHHCGHSQKIYFHCQQCQASMQPLGFGTQRLEETLREYFPKTPILRVDRDSTTKKNSFEKILTQVNKDESLILLGTQMLAKGHHFPAVTMVGILNADSGLYSPDFRGPEHLAQLLLQVAGRAGRADSPGEVFVQTYWPEHPLWHDLCKPQGYMHFAKICLQQRALAELPPFYYAALIGAEAKNTEVARDFLKEIMTMSELLCASTVLLLGPIAALQAKRAGYYRSQILCISAKRHDLQQLLAQLIPQISKIKLANKVRWYLDVDPVEFL